MELQEKLNILRKQHKLTQMELAHELEVSRQAISKWEQGTALPSTENLIRLAELYGVSVEVLTNPKLPLDGAEQQKPVDTQNAPSAEAKPDTGKIKRLVAAALVAGVVLGGLLVGMVAFSGGAKAPEETTPIKDLEKEVGFIVDEEFSMD